MNWTQLLGAVVLAIVIALLVGFVLGAVMEDWSNVEGE